MNEHLGPDDIEVGDEVIEVERRERAGVIVSVRLSAEEADRLQSMAEDQKTTLSRVAREVIANYLAHGRQGADETPVAGPPRLINRA